MHQYALARSAGAHAIARPRIPNGSRSAHPECRRRGSAARATRAPPHASPVATLSTPKQRELVFLEQRNDARRAPAPDHIQIRLETALPARTLHAVALLAGAEERRQPLPDPTFHLCDPQRIRLTGPNHDSSQSSSRFCARARGWLRASLRKLHPLEQRLIPRIVFESLQDCVHLDIQQLRISHRQRDDRDVTHLGEPAACGTYSLLVSTRRSARARSRPASPPPPSPPPRSP